MFATQATALEIEHAKAILILLAAAMVMFWRVALRVLLAAIVVAVGAGAFLLLQGMHR